MPIAVQKAVGGLKSSGQIEVYAFGTKLRMVYLDFSATFANNKL
jgi:hypothetical protein